MKIISRSDAKAAGHKHYFTGKPCKRGGIGVRLVSDGQCQCELCRLKKSQYQAGYYQIWADQNRATIKSYQSKYRTENRRKRVTYNASWKEANKERHAAFQAAYRSRNLDKGAARTAMRRARIAAATPAWLTSTHQAEIAKAYAMREKISAITGIEHHVDHVIPLNGVRVCGLHVPWNLQVIPAKDNMKKSNKVTG